MPARETRREVGLEWEPIPDDVLVPRRDRRDRFARPFPPDVQVVRRRNVGVDAVDAADRRSVPRARGKRPRRAVVDDVHDAHDAAAPVAVAGLDDSLDPNAVLAAHLSSGWSLGRKSDGDGRSLVPPGDGARGATTPANADRGTTSSELLVVRRAYGIEPPNAPSRASAPSDAAFASLSSAVSCARLCAAVLRRRDWCASAVDAAHSAVGAFRREVASARRDGTLRAPAVVRGRSVAAPEDEMAASVRRALAAAKVALEGAVGGRETRGGREKSGGDRGDGRDDPFAAAMAAMGGDSPGGDSPDASEHSSNAILDAPVAVAVAVALDDAMYAMAYHHRSCGWTSGDGSWWPNPAAYLAAVTASHGRCGADVSTVSKFVSSVASAVKDDVLEGAREWEWLDAIRRSRTAEATWLLTATGAVTAADVLAAGRRAAAEAKRKTRGRATTTGDGTPPPPPCPKLVQLWRDGARVWPCRLFAFATPTRRALRALCDASVSWVEVGAGLGYWALAMESSFGMDVVALDKTPNTEGFGGDSPGGGEWDEGAMNEYHGRAASFVKVREGGPRDLRRYKNRALFLCYPPPGDDLAARSIREHGGDVVAVVGEWDGNTGDVAFARELRESWNLARRVSLPQWGDTAHELTIWQRKKTDSTERGGTRGAQTRVSASAFAACHTCGRGDHDRVLRRCVYCRVVCFCSEKCSRDVHSTRAHSDEHALRDLAWTAPAYSDEASFRVFRPCGG